MAQLGLFEPLPEPLSAAPPLLKGRLPERLYLGTSSWTFPGWKDLVYRGAFKEKDLAFEGLEHYAAQRLFRTVGLDRTFYAPIEKEVYADYARRLPNDFRMLVKAPELLMHRRFPEHARYGAQAGRFNPDFLNRDSALRLLVEPAREGLGSKLGPILFQFPPQNPAEMGGPEAFAEQLGAFLEDLPSELDLAVELRNRDLFERPYWDQLKRVKASHCLNIHPTMAEPWEQAKAFGRPTKKVTVIRWMMGRIHDYEKARKRYHPFDRRLDPEPRMLNGLARMCAAALKAGHTVYVIVNNKAEGCAPLTLLELALRLGDLNSG